MQKKDDQRPRSRPGKPLTKALKPTAVGNEESGQASPSSTTAAEHDYHDYHNYGNVDEPSSNNTTNNTTSPSVNLPVVENSSSYSVANDIANISPLGSSDENISDNDVEVNNPTNQATVRRRRSVRSNVGTGTSRTQEENTGGGDWFGNGLLDPNNESSFTDFFYHFCLACVVAVGILVVADIIEGVFRQPGIPRYRKQIHRRKRKTA